MASHCTRTCSTTSLKTGHSSRSAFADFLQDAGVEADQTGLLSGCEITLWLLFQLLEVQVSDMAVYLCVAENKVGTVEKLFSLTVQGREVCLTVE